MRVGWKTRNDSWKRGNDGVAQEITRRQGGRKTCKLLGIE